MIAFPECRGEACDVRSVHCEIDHILAWIDGGTTDDINGQPLCKRENRFKERLAAFRRRSEPGRPPPLTGRRTRTTIRFNQQTG